MVGRASGEFLLERQPAGLEQFVQHLGVVLHGDTIALELVFVLERVEGVRVRGDDDLAAVLPLDLAESVEVLAAEHLEETLFTHAAHVIAGVALTFVEEAEVHAGLLENFRRGLGDFEHARIVGSVVAHEPDAVHRLLAGVLDLGRQTLRPFGAHAIGLVERVAVAVETVERVLHGFVHRALAHQIAAQVHDGARLLDEDRAHFLARAAGGAGPQFVGGDDLLVM